ncbi:MAG TPA: hypothetical protein VFW46_07965 [Stellaceae bacterium]|nr:hypothetical protein [Stellaceae bacterium]
MDIAPQFLLIGAVAAIGVLHTMVPDHWVPITVIARQQGWSRRETARNAFIAGAGHVVSTLLIALAVWVAGAAFAQRFGTMVDTAASVALIAFGVWIALSAWPERHGHSHPHGQGGHHHHQHGGDASAVLFRHTHPHRHGAGPAHVHWHQHSAGTAHAIALGDPPLHEHAHAAIGRAGLLLILGSSPMVEGIPAFFAAGRYGPGLIAAMASVFAVSTITTYVVLCVASVAGLQRVGIGPLERYGEVLSGAVIAALGLVFWLL